MAVYIFCVPGQPAVYVLADRPNATRLDYLYQGQISPGDAALAVVKLAAARTRLVVVAPAAAPWQERLELDPRVAHHLAQHYRLAATFGDYAVLRRQP